MDGQMLSTLSRGRGHKGEVHGDHKTKYPQSIPYFLRDVAKDKSSFPPLPNESKFRNIPGTYLTERGQMILYTKDKKTEKIKKETADHCNKISDLYELVHCVTNDFKNKNICESQRRLKLGDLHSMAGSLKNDWFFPQKWNSPAKEIIPDEALLKGEDIDDFLRSRKIKKLKSKKSKSIVSNSNKNISNSLVNVESSDHNNLLLQRQNNAMESSYETENITRSITADCSVSWNESVNGTITPLSMNGDSNARSSNECFYDVEEEYIIRRNTHKNSLHHFDDKDLFNLEKNPIEIKDVLGGDSTLNDIRKIDINKIVSRQNKLNKNEQSEELRISLLKNLYDKLNFLSLAKHQLKTYSQNLFSQMLEYNSENRKIRIMELKEKLYQILHEMKERNDEIKARIQRISEKTVLDKKDHIDKLSFNKEWDQMLLDISRKSNSDNQFIEDKKEKLILEEEIKIKALENDKLEIENSSIIYAFSTLRNELTKLEEEKNDIEHFIIRLEMGRENVVKIEREISTITPPPFKLSKNNFQNYFKKIKEQTIISWQIKMYNFGEGFKVDESKLVDMLMSESELDRFIKDKGGINSNSTNINLNAYPTKDIKTGGSKKISESEDLMTETNKSQSLSNSQKNYLMKLDYEQMKMDQRISSNYTYSYFMPWPREHYERDFIPPSNMSDSEDELKPSKSCKLNYKRILAHNPLKERKLRKNKK